MIFDLPPPAIIQRAEAWELDLHRKLSPLGLPRHVRRAIVAEIRNLEGAPQTIIKPALADVARYGKDPALAHILCPPIGWNAAAVTPFSLTQTAFAVDDSNTADYSFASQSFGAEDGSRYMLAALAASIGTPTINSVTIGGVTATLVVTTTSSTAQIRIAIYKAAVPTGTTGTVAIALGSVANRCGLVLWRLVGANPAETAAPSVSTPTSNAFAASLTIPSGGGGVGYVFASGTAGPKTWTWTNLTEGGDATVEGDISHSSALSTTAGAATRTATASGTIAANEGAAVFAAWGP